jgi:two-component system response regulator AtoC
MPLILLGVSDAGTAEHLGMIAQCLGFRTVSLPDGQRVLDALRSSQEDVASVVLDATLPVLDGWETLEVIRRRHAALPVILLSDGQPGEGGERGAGTEILIKPVRNDEFELALLRWGFGHALENRPGSLSMGPSYVSGGSALQKIEGLVNQVAPMDVPVLLLGETGVGKEVVARMIHAASPRRSFPFLKLNCAALPSELIESELFGYERGAFTGAAKKTPGKFDLAEGGTILLDEIGEMDFRLQSKLLHVLQDQEYYPLGSKETVKVNVRVIAATHSDLETSIAENRFREDLYYRLNVVQIHIPPLRERGDEIVLLASHFLVKYSMGGTPPPPVTPELERALLQHSWPGNIRELENVMRKYLIFRDPGEVVDELRSKTRRHGAKPAAAANGTAVASAEPLASLDRVHTANQQAEVEAILHALEYTRWNRKRAAVLLQTDYKALLYKMKKLGLTEPRVPYTNGIAAGSAATRSTGSNSR